MDSLPPLSTAVKTAVPLRSAPDGRGGWQWLPGALLFLALCAASIRLLVRNQLHGVLWDTVSPDLYLAATLGFNYFEFGAVRRGLGGSIVHLLHPDLLRGTMIFHVLSAATFSAAVAVLWHRLETTPSKRLGYALVAVAIMLRWAEDAGRSDVAVAALLAWGTVALQRDRLDWAAAAVCVGLFVHESSFIFGLPLLAGFVVSRGELGALDRAVAQRAAALAVLTMLLYAGMGLLPRAEPGFMVEAVRAKLPLHEFADWAIYFALSGSRGVMTSLCQNRTDPSYWTHPFSGAVVLLAAGIALARRGKHGWLAMLLVALPPFAFLCVVANDAARWTMLAALNLWLLGAAQRSVAGEAARFDWRAPGAWLAVSAALAFQPLSDAASRRVEFPLFAGSPLIEQLLHRAGVPPTPGFWEVLKRCDPTWRSVLDDATAAAPAPPTARPNPRPER